MKINKSWSSHKLRTVCNVHYLFMQVMLYIYIYIYTLYKSLLVNLDIYTSVFLWSYSAHMHLYTSTLVTYPVLKYCMCLQYLHMHLKYFIFRYRYTVLQSFIRIHIISSRNSIHANFKHCSLVIVILPCVLYTSI